MGSVAKVRKRNSVVGGSARKDLRDHYRKQRHLTTCFELPLVGGFFRFCLKNQLEFREQRDAFSDSHRSYNASSLGEYGEAESSQSSNKEMVYAMKSIHLSRVTDENFLKELRNEISVLRTLDHPHIVKAIETFEHRNQIFIIMELCYGGDLYSRDP